MGAFGARGTNNSRLAGKRGSTAKIYCGAKDCSTFNGFRCRGSLVPDGPYNGRKNVVGDIPKSRRDVRRYENSIMITMARKSQIAKKPINHPVSKSRRDTTVEKISCVIF
jgi:hypothetical protein